MAEKGVFEQIKKQNGERFAKAIRGFDNGIFDIPGIVDIVKYAGHEAEPIMEYLESLKQIHIEETGAYQDPITLLDKAGYDAYYVTNLEEQNAIKKYYAEGEALCTFHDSHRFENYHIVNAVRKDVDQIRREDFKGRERREDEYGTSVLSIQILKKGGFISIKNRYNHTVPNPDNTLNSNPDNIIPGLSNSLRHHFQTDFSAQKVKLPPNFAVVNNQIVRYNYEQDNIYFGSDFYVKDGAIHPLNSHEIMMDTYIFDLKTKAFSYPLNEEITEEDTTFKEVFSQELAGHKVILRKDKEGQHLFIRKEGEKDPEKDIEILTIKDGCIMALNLPTATKIGDNFLFYNRTVKKIGIPQVKSIGEDFLRFNTTLEQLDAPSLEQTTGAFLYNNKGLKTLKLPHLKSVGSGFLHYNTDLDEFDAPLLKKVGNAFLEENRALKTLRLPSLKFAYHGFLYSNTDLKEFEAPLLEEAGDRFLEANEGLKVLRLPNLNSAGDWFLRSNTDLKEFEAPLLERAGFYFLGNNIGLRTLCLPHLKSTEHRFLGKNTDLERLEAPLLEKVSSDFLYNNKKIKVLNLPSLESIDINFMFSNTSLEQFYAPNLNQMNSSLFFSHPHREFLWEYRADLPKVGISAQLKPTVNMGQGIKPAEQQEDSSDEQDATTLKRLRDKFLPQK